MMHANDVISKHGLFDAGAGIVAVGLAAAGNVIIDHVEVHRNGKNLFLAELQNELI